jgi:hypothetical protein
MKGHLSVRHFVCGLVWKTLFIIFLSVGHRNLVNLSVRHRTVSSKQKNSKNFVQ